MKSQILKTALFFGFCALTSVPAQALNTQRLHPSNGHDGGYQVRTTETVERGTLTGGLHFNYAHEPLELVVAGVGGLPRAAGIVDQFITADAVVSYGILDRWSLTIDVPFNLYHNIAPTFIPTRDKGFGDIGDIHIESKIRIFDHNDFPHLGFTLIPFASLPTGENSVLFGDNSAAGGLLLAGDIKFGDNLIYANLGSRFRKEENIGNLSVQHEMLYGVGYERPIVKSWALDGVAEFHGATNYESFMTQAISSPLEFVGTLRKKWTKSRNLITYAGVGAAVTNGYGEPSVRGTLGISYGGNILPKKPKIKRDKIHLRGQVNFDHDKSTIRPESYATLDGIVALLQQYNDFSLVVVEGHTDNVGSDAYNEKLSQRRAESVRNYLIGKGIDANRLKAVGYGESRPIASNDTADGRFQNRRTEFVEQTIVVETVTKRKR